MNYFETAVFYQIFPYGLLGTSQTNDFTSQPSDGFIKLQEWLPHIYNLGANALYLCPIFESTSHGYDTRDYRIVDRRLGTNDDLKAFVKACHEKGIRVVLDGVFNHVGRDFLQFQDVIKNRENSEYKNWFKINFDGNSSYNDGFWYEGWEGHFALVELNLANPDVREYLFNSVKMWINEFDINGLRLDVAYLLPHDFLRELCSVCRDIKPDFWVVGEVLHGDYNVILNAGTIDSVTNYECYKGLYSSFNSTNMFEIAYSLNRQFGNENWTLYKGRHLLNFVDNHDVSRIASLLTNKEHLALIYTLLFTMPGIPCIYYGSEWGVLGEKGNDDWVLRPRFDIPEWSELTEFISKLAKLHKENKCLTNGNYEQLYLTNSQYIFSRSVDGKRVMITINISNEEHIAHFNANAGCGTDALTGEKVDFGGGLRLKPYSAMVVVEMG
ncbi:MAG: cyclomaltodextrinase [Oscillospiraceae bacterium]|nr:cyclomaltodextrinase [Oscillospiraceae bacterium]